MSGTAIALRVSQSCKLYRHLADRLKEALYPLAKRYHADFYACEVR